MQSRRILPVESRKVDAIEAHQSAAGPDPKVSIPRLGEGLHRLFGQPIGRLPDVPRISGKCIGFRRCAPAHTHHKPGGRRNPGGNRSYSMHGGAQYTAKQVIPAYEPLCPIHSRSICSAGLPAGCNADVPVRVRARPILFAPFANGGKPASLSQRLREQDKFRSVSDFRRIKKTPRRNTVVFLEDDAAMSLSREDWRHGAYCNVFLYTVHPEWLPNLPDLDLQSLDFQTHDSQS
jgi:hypothetical protein